MLNRLTLFNLLESLVYNKHQKTISRMHGLHYKADNRGICSGIAHMGVQAILAEDIQRFSNRLDYINKLTFEEHTTVVNEEKAKQKFRIQHAKSMLTEDTSNSTSTILKISENVNSHLSEAERNLLEIPAFFDGVQLLSQPHSHPELFDTKLLEVQDAERVFPIIQSHKIESKGGICSVSTHSGVYTREELISFFSMLKYTMNTEPSLNSAIALTLDNTKHIISVGYDCKADKWIFIDANQIPVKVINTCDELCTYIQKAFACKELTALAMNFYTTQPYKKYFLDKLDVLHTMPKWKAMHEITTEKVLFTDPSKSTWLDCAAKIGNIEIFKELVKAGADTIDSEPLKYAICFNRLGIAEYILQTYRYNQPERRPKVFNPLTLCIGTENREMLALLLKYKDMLPSSIDDETFSLNAACVRQNIEMTRLLLEAKVDPNQKSDDGYTPLIFAILYENFELVKLLLHHHADINLSNNDGNTPLIHACVINPTIAMHLVKEGANPNLFNKEHSTALIEASTRGLMPILHELLKRNANVNQVFDAREYPLRDHAYKKRHLPKFATLLEKHHIIQKTIPAMTALHMAACYGHFDAVKLLVENNANVDSAIQGGITPAEMAESIGYNEIAVFLYLQYYKLQLTSCESHRRLAINTLLKNTAEQKSAPDIVSEINLFKELDTIAQQLLTITHEYKSQNSQRIKKLNELHEAVLQAYQRYTAKPTDTAILSELNEKANIIAAEVEDDHRRHSTLFSLYGKKSTLATSIRAVTHFTETHQSELKAQLK